MHIHTLCDAQKTTILHSVDAHGGFPPSAAASAVPLWRFNYLHNYMGPVFSVALFFAQISTSRSLPQASGHEKAAAGGPAAALMFFVGRGLLAGSAEALDA
ncbi:hypothetical protein JJB09_07870 [Rhizobium sp. KVB221]|uniref:Uncharacterized protein n=1 Tax=Rhizobium setariae TaxID=2801340 RepID=A0A936YS97_9HYPH|nr:hypothetical protein [Rhizobium setariae]MBL0371941.1 hypothetical protein [Rhizobium setariae]